MPKVHRVAKAQQRYAMVPDIDPATGQQRTLTTRQKGRGGAPVVRQLTKPDLSQPLEPRTCGFCHEPIETGTAYKWMAVKSGPRSSRKLYRHAHHPDWHYWEYSDSLAAQVAQVAWNFQQAVYTATSADDVESAVEDAAGEIESIADAKDEAADNIESGFEHATSQSDELRDIAEQLRELADGLRNEPVPDFPDTEDEECETCEGSGKVVQLSEDAEPEPWREGSYAEGVVRECGECSGSGHPEEVTEQQLDDWRNEVDAAFTIESPA